MLAEAAAWGGKVLLHREVPSNGAAGGPTPRRPLSRAASRGGEPPGAPPSAGGAAGEEAGADGGGDAEDITRTTQYQPVMQVQAFWETTGDVGDIDQVGRLGGGAPAAAGSQGYAGRPASPAAAPASTALSGDWRLSIAMAANLEWQAPQACQHAPMTALTGAGPLSVTPFWVSLPALQGLCTPREVFVAIAAEGYQISYKRVPMSRERTPQAADLDQLLAQMGNHPAGKEVRGQGGGPGPAGRARPSLRLVGPGDPT